MGNLNFDISLDNSQFIQAIKQVQSAVHFASVYSQVKAKAIDDAFSSAGDNISDATHKARKFIQEMDELDKHLDYDRSINTLKRKVGDANSIATIKYLRKEINMAMRSASDSQAIQQYKQLVDILNSKLENIKQGNISGPLKPLSPEARAWLEQAHSRASQVRGNKHELTQFRKELSKALNEVDVSSQLYQEIKKLKDSLRARQSKGLRSKASPFAQENTIASAQSSLNFTLVKQELEREKLTVKLQNKLDNAEAQAIRDGEKHVLSALQQRLNNKLTAIEVEKRNAVKAEVARQKAVFDAEQRIVKAQKGKIQVWDDSKIDSKTINDIDNYYSRYEQAVRKLWSQDIVERERNALNQYLQQYGSYEQKKLAIAQDYAERIKQADTEAEKLSLQAQLQSAQQALTSEHNKKLLGFEDLFANIESMTVTQLQSIKDRLNELMASGTLSLSDYKDAAQQIDGINSAIIAAQDQEKGLLGGIIQQSVERRKIEMDIADAKLRQNDLTTQQAQAQARVDQLRGSLQQATGVKNVSVDNQAAVLGMAKAIYGEDSPQYQQVLKGMQKLAEAERHLNDVTEQKTKTDNDLANAEQRLSKYMGDLQKRVADFAAQLEGVNTNIQSLPGLFESLGFDSESGVGKVVNDLAEGANAGMNAMKDFASGNYIGAAKNALDAIGSFGRMGIGIFAGQGNVKAMEEEIEKLSKSNDQLARSIEGLKDSITDADATNEQSVEAYKKARDAEQEWTANMQKMINDRSSEYSNSGHGFLGLKGRKSFNHYLDERGAGWWGWAQFNAALSANGSKNTVNSAAELWSLSPEEMKVLRDFAPAAWAEMLKTKGEANPEELLNDYINHAGMAESLLDALNEKLTGYSWEGFRDSFSSMLKDLGSDITDFANFIDEVIANALIEAFVADQLSPRIKNLQQMIADAAEDGIIDATEQAAIQAENNAIATDALNWRNNMEALGLIKRQQDEQQATANGASQITYDQANLLVGRVTALQIQGEQRNGMLSTVVESMNNLASAALVSGTSVEDMRNLMVINNSYLEDISKYTKRIYNEFNAQLVQLNNNIKSL